MKRKNRIGLIGIGLLSAFLMIAVSAPWEKIPHANITLPAHAQEASPSPATLPTAPAASPENSPTPAQSPTPSPEASPTPSPTPEINPTPEITPSPTPTTSPTPEISPTPEASPSPTPEISPTPEETPTPETSDAPLPPLLLLEEKPYTDTAMGYQLGILKDYKQARVAGVTLFESPDGNLAYIVTVRPRATDNQLQDTALAQVAIEVFARGEGFVAGKFEPAFGGAKIPWTANVSQGRNAQPLSGLILSRQFTGKVLILCISATEAKAGELESVFATLAETLQPIDS